jgi:hypothetical protein
MNQDNVEENPKNNFKLTEEELLYIEYLTTTKYQIPQFITGINKYYDDSDFRDKFNFYLSIYTKAYFFFHNRELPNYLTIWQEYLMAYYDHNHEYENKVKIIYFLTDIINNQPLEYITLLGDIWIGLIFMYGFDLKKTDKKMVYDFVMNHFDNDYFQKEFQHFIFQSYIERNFLSNYKNNTSDVIYNKRLSVGYGSILLFLLDLWENYKDEKISSSYPNCQNFYIRNINNTENPDIEIDFLYQLQELGLFASFIENHNNQNSDDDSDDDSYDDSDDDFDDTSEVRPASPIDEELESDDDNFDLEYWISESEDNESDDDEIDDDFPNVPDEEIIPSPLAESDNEDNEENINHATKIFYMILTLIDNCFVSCMERITYIHKDIENKNKKIISGKKKNIINPSKLGQIDVERLRNNLFLDYAQNEVEKLKETYKHLLMIYDLSDLERIIDFINLSLRWVKNSDIDSATQNTLTICVQTYNHLFKLIEEVSSMEISFLWKTKVMEIGTCLFHILDKPNFNNISLKSQLFLVVYNQVLTENKDLNYSPEELKYCYSGIVKLFLDLDKTDYDIDGQISYEKDYHQLLILQYFSERINCQEFHYDSNFDSVVEWVFEHGKIMSFLISLTNHITDKIDNSLTNIEEYKKLKDDKSRFMIKNFQDIYQYSVFNTKFLEYSFMILSIISQKYRHLVQSDKLLSYLVPGLRYKLKTLSDNGRIFDSDNPHYISATEQDFLNYYPLQIYEFIADQFLIWIDKNDFYRQLVADHYKPEDTLFSDLASLLRNYSHYQVIREGVDYLDYIPKFYQSFLDKNPEQASRMNLPDEFIDPILCMPIDNPVVIPGTNGLIMDKSSIEQQIETLGFNPYTRQKLTLEELNEFNSEEENKKLIEEFKVKLQQYYSSS